MRDLLCRVLYVDEFSTNNPSTEAQELYANVHIALV